MQAKSFPLTPTQKAAALRGCLQRGFSMLEVMIVLLVLSFGLLAVAGLQANTAKFKINSWARSAAAVQFSALADSIRANPSAAGSDYFATSAVTSAYGVNANWATQQADALAISRDCSMTSCTDAQRAEFDLLSWRRDVRRLLPQGAVVVTGNRSAGINTTIAWFDKQFVEPSGAMGRSDVCAATLTGVAQVNCCPADLVGDPAIEGVRCSNVSFLP
jgi:type IV pilus assembly protein PilV